MRHNIALRCVGFLDDENWLWSLIPAIDQVPFILFWHSKVEIAVIGSPRDQHTGMHARRDTYAHAHAHRA